MVLGKGKKGGGMKVCQYPKCSTNLRIRNKSKFCSVHGIVAVTEKEQRKEWKRLKNSKRWRQITSWLESTKHLMHCFDNFPKGMCRVKQKEVKGMIWFAVFRRV